MCAIEYWTEQVAKGSPQTDGCGDRISNAGSVEIDVLEKPTHPGLVCPQTVFDGFDV